MSFSLLLQNYGHALASHSKNKMLKEWDGQNCLIQSIGTSKGIITMSLVQLEKQEILSGRRRVNI